MSECNNSVDKKILKNQGFFVEINFALLYYFTCQVCNNLETRKADVENLLLPKIHLPPALSDSIKLISEH